MTRKDLLAGHRQPGTCAADELRRQRVSQGVELIHKQLQAALVRLSVQPIAAKGQPFDPRMHEAIEMVETSEAPDHQVIEELQRGYKFKDRLAAARDGQGRQELGEIDSGKRCSEINPGKEFSSPL